MKIQTSLLFLAIIAFTACKQDGAETTPVRKRVTNTVFASGNLEANGTYALTAQSDGYLTEVAFSENQIVEQGQILAVIDNKLNEINTSRSDALYRVAQQNASTNSPILKQSKIAIDLAKKNLEFDSAQVTRYQKLLKANSISKVEYETIVLEYQKSQNEYSRAVENYSLQRQQVSEDLIVNRAQKTSNKVLLEFNQIRALYPGRVYSKLKEKGDFVRKGDVIATIGDANMIYASVGIDESSISQVKVGQEAIIQLNTNKEKTYKGRVSEISPAFQEETQSFICKITFLDSLEFRIVNTPLQVNIITGITDNALLIPRAYLQYGNKVSVKGEKEPRKIETKFISSEWVQVLSGIDEKTVLTTNKIN